MYHGLWPSEDIGDRPHIFKEDHDVGSTQHTCVRHQLCEKKTWKKEVNKIYTDMEEIPTVLHMSNRATKVTYVHYPKASTHGYLNKEFNDLSDK